MKNQRKKVKCGYQLLDKSCKTQNFDCSFIKPSTATSPQLLPPAGTTGDDHHAISKRAAAFKDPAFYWPNGTVPYVFSPSFLEPEYEGYRDRVRQAMWHVEFNTCVRFREMAGPGSGDHVVLYNNATYCISHVTA